MLRSTQYVTIDRAPFIVTAAPCLLAGLTIHENNTSAVLYELYDNNGSGAKMMCFVIGAKQVLHIKFPAPIRFKNQLYFYSADVAAAPTGAFEFA